MSVRLQFRRGTASQWTNANPVLFAGEIGLETDTKLIKVGDGSTTWTSLDYATVSPNSLIEQSQDAVNTALTAGNGITKTYDDGANTITLAVDTSVVAVKSELTEAAQDAVNTALVAGTGLDKTYDDNGNTITLDIDSTVTTNSGSQTLTNKTIAFGSNTVSGTLAEFNTAVTDANLASIAGAETLTSKTIALGSNTISGTTAEFNTALTDGDFATQAGAETLTNKTIALGNNTVSGTLAQFNTAVTDADLASLAGSETLTNKTINGSNNTITNVSLTTGVTGTLPVANGGTGVTTSTGSGNAVLSASPTLSGTVSAENITLSGDLTVNGTTTNINSTNLVVEDKNIVIGDTATPSDATADGGGITLKGTTDKTFNWLDSTDAWTSSEHVAVAAGKEFKGNVTGNVTGVINGSVSGNAGTATRLETARNINGVSFDGTANITVAADANTLSGNTLAGGVTTSSLTALGTVATGTWNATTIAIANGGTGQTTATAATNALLPAQTGNANKVLKTDGTDVSWTSTPSFTGLTVSTNDLDVGSQSDGLRTTDGYTNPMAVFSIDADNDYAQLVVKNTGNGTNSSSDVIVYADNGDDVSGWMDMGITSSAFADPGFTVTGKNDGYIFMEAPVGNVKSVNNKELTDNVVTLTTSAAHGFATNDKVVVSGVGTPFNGVYTITGTPTSTTFTYAKNNANINSAVVSPVGEAKVATGDGNLVLATGGNGTRNKIVFAAGGLASDNTQMEITPDVNVHIEIPTPSTSSTTGALTVVGGVGIQGDINLEGDLDVNGTVDFSGVTELPIGSNANTFLASLTNPVVVIDTNDNDYAQVAFQNRSANANASTDFIAYANNGTDEDGYIDMGITSSAFSDPGFTITGENDGYIFMVAPDETTGNGDLVLATGDTGVRNAIVFAAGGLASNDTQMTIIPNQKVAIDISTESTSPSTGALVVSGGVGVSGNLNVQGNVDIEGTITFGGAGTTLETANLAVTDPAVFVGTNNQADIVDLAFIGEYATSVSPIAAVVNNKALTNNVATLTTASAHTYLAGDIVTITDVDATFNGTYNIIDVPTSTTFTYAKTAANVSSAAVSPTGNASVTARRKFSGIARDASDGVIKAFKDATTKPTSTINFSEAGLGFADLRVGGLTASSATIGSVTNTEIGYLSGVSSAIQTQINAKLDSSTASSTYAPINNPTFTGTVSLPTTIEFEGSTADTFETQLTVEDPTADRTITLPNATGTVSLVSNNETLTNKSIALGSNTITGTLAQFNTAVTDADFASLAGSETLTNKTLTTPIISSISNSGTVTLPTGNVTLSTLTGSETFTNKTLTAPSITGWTKLQQVLEKATVEATALSGTYNYDVTSKGAVLNLTSNAGGNWTMNIRGDSGTTLNTIMATGDSLTVAIAVPMTTAYYQTGFQIDGSNVTVKWQDAAPTSGNANSTDMYAFTIIKTGNAAYTVFGSRSKFV